jgi:hypothetical protein
MAGFSLQTLFFLIRKFTYQVSRRCPYATRRVSFFLDHEFISWQYIGMKNVSAHKLELWVRARGLKKGDVARSLGISPPVLSKILKSRQLPDVALAVKIEELTEGYVSIRGWSVEVRTDLTQSPDQCIGV